MNPETRRAVKLLAGPQDVNIFPANDLFVTRKTTIKTGLFPELLNYVGQVTHILIFASSSRVKGEALCCGYVKRLHVGYYL